MRDDTDQARTRAIIDLVVIGLVAVAAFALAARYDLVERYMAWTQAYESWQLDELVVLGGVLALALAGFALRRWADLRHEMARRAEAQSAREEAEGRYRALIETSPDAITLTDLQGTIVMANQQSAVLHGFDSPEAMVGVNAWDLISVDDHARGREDAARILEEGSIHNVEYTALKADGETAYPAEMSVSLLKDQQNNPEYLLAVIRDVSWRNQAEAALHNNLSRLEILHQIDRAMLAAQSCEEIARVALDALRRLLGPDLRANVIVSSPNSVEGTVLASSVPDDPLLHPGTRVPLAEIYASGKLSEQGVVYIDDLALIPAPLPLLQRLRSEGIRSVMIVPMVLQDAIVGTLNLGSTEPRAFRPEHEQISIEVAEALALAIHQARLAEEVALSREHLSRLSGRLIETQELERQRIARELHDQIGQSLVAIKLQLQSMSGLSDRDHLVVRLRESIAVVERTIRQVRDLSFDLRPSVLDDLGLVATLRWYVDRQCGWAGVQAQFVPDPPEMDLPAQIEVAAFRITQEALTNVLHHAQATEVCVCLEQREGELVLRVQDDGVGFDEAAVQRGDHEGQSLGLLGMRERAQLAGGRLEIESAPGQGTMVRARLPLPPEGPGG